MILFKNIMVLLLLSCIVFFGLYFFFSETAIDVLGTAYYDIDFNVKSNLKDKIIEAIDTQSMKEEVNIDDIEKVDQETLLDIVSSLDSNTLNSILEYLENTK